MLHYNNSLEKIVKNVKQKRMVKRTVALMSVAVILITFNSTKFKADTLKRITDCGYNYDHQHGPECYDASGELVCELHVHMDACYQRRPVSDTDAEVYEDEPVVEPVEEVVSEPVDQPVVEAESEQVEAAVEEVDAQLVGDEGEAFEIEAPFYLVKYAELPPTPPKYEYTVKVDDAEHGTVSGINKEFPRPSPIQKNERKEEQTRKRKKAAKSEEKQPFFYCKVGHFVV